MRVIIDSLVAICTLHYYSNDLTYIVILIHVLLYNNVPCGYLYPYPYFKMLSVYVTVFAPFLKSYQIPNPYPPESKI